MLASVENVLAGLVSRPLPVRKIARREMGDIGGDFREAVKKTVATDIAAGLTGVAADLLLTKGAVLPALVDQFAQTFVWLSKILNALELG